MEEFKNEVSDLFTLEDLRFCPEESRSVLSSLLRRCELENEIPAIDETTKKLVYRILASEHPNALIRQYPNYEKHRKLFGAKVDNLDISKEAIELSSTLTGVLDKGNTYSGSFILGDAGTVDLSGGLFDVIMIVALAGDSQMEKQRLIVDMQGHLKWNGRLIIQCSNRKLPGSNLLFHEIDPNLLQGLDVIFTSSADKDGHETLTERIFCSKRAN